MSVSHPSARGARASKARTGFYFHLAAYVLVNAVLVGVNLTTNPDRLWVQWPLLGWGLGLAAHAVVAFALAGRRTRP